MAAIALVCPPFAAHIASFRALGEELARRGHRPFFLLNADAPASAGAIPVVRVPARRGDPPVTAVLARAERPGGLLATLRTVADAAAMTGQLCEGGRAALAAQGAALVIGDQLEPAGRLLAEAMGLPFMGLACAVPLDPAPGVPLPFLDWPFQPGEEAKLRRTDAIGDALSARQHRVIADWSRRFGLPERRTLRDCLAPVQAAQMIPALDLPRPEPLPFVPVGPLRRPEELADAPLPFALPGGAPLVFATMGTMLGGNIRVWRALAAACRSAGAALVIAHGGRLSAKEAAELDVHHAADFLPYRAVMRRAALVITHGGSNTVLDALASGCPLLVRPVGFDQPGNLARIRHHGLGEKLASLRRPARIAAQVGRILADPATRARCRAVGAALEAAGGAGRAADLAERQLVANRAAPLTNRGSPPLR